MKLESVNYWRDKNSRLSKGLVKSDNEFANAVRNIPVRLNDDNWFNFNSKSGIYNGHKLHMGSRRGIYYLGKSTKVYVTKYFHSLDHKLG